MVAWQWTDEQHLRVGDRSFVVGSVELVPVPGQLLVVKTPDLVDRYLSLVESERPLRIVELGAKAGGSTALLALVARPELLVSIDLAAAVPQPLADLIEAEGLGEILVTRFGIDQGDRAALTEAVREPLGDEPLDLVVDDASHILGPTRTSFEVLFPRLRAGGLYVIEDWSSELLAAERVARFVPPSAADFTRRLHAVQNVLHTLNAPDRDLPPQVLAKMTDAHAHRSEWARPATDPGDDEGDGAEQGALFAMLIDAAANADLGPDDGLAPGGIRPMMDLAVELTMICASGRGLVSEVRVDGDWIVARRGPAVLDAQSFRLDDAWSDYFGYLG